MGEEKAKTRPTFVIMGVVLVCLMFYLTFGFFVIPPIGAAPEGVTILYFRLGSSIDFIESPDGMAMDKNGQLSLLGRGMALAAFMGAKKSSIIVRLPYLHPMYLISTGGKDFTR